MEKKYKIKKNKNIQIDSIYLLVLGSSIIFNMKKNILLSPAAKIGWI